MAFDKRINIYLPVIIALSVVAGMLVSALAPGHDTTGKLLNFKRGQDGNQKINQVLRYIKKEYVDTLDMDKLTDDAIIRLLAELDPHSYYIPAKELQSMNESLDGKFEGIGIEFNIQSDTIVVVAPISGGPSEQLGILPGDRIVQVEEETVAGVGITNQDVMDRLRGKGGTEVTIRIFRRGHSQLIPFTITRGQIPIFSVDVAYMVDDLTGYIKISRFSKNTYEEYMDAFQSLQAEGMERLVLDLRGNPGGYLQSATMLADEFLADNTLVVYTEGQARPRTRYFATSSGGFEEDVLVVLIDEGSASASEIIAGAVQDNDRGYIVGRRSFGKGLVQEQSVFPDGSAIRLTIARYFTPTGRCIQRAYENGVEAYYGELYDRLSKEEEDSLYRADSLMFKTPGGRMVYGGGGIKPDYTVDIDTSYYSLYLNRIVTRGIINQFSFYYADNHRELLEKNYSAVSYVKNFKLDQAIQDEFIEFAADKGVSFDAAGWERSERSVITRIKAGIGRQIWREQAFYPVLLEEDNIFRKALEVIKKGA